MAKNWIADMHMKKGALHAELGVPQGQKIPASEITTASHSKNPLLRRRAILAKTLKKLHK